MTGRVRSPGLGAVAFIALLATAAGLALAGAVLTFPVALDRRDAPALVAVTLSQALAWWWSRRRQRGLVRAAYRLAAENRSLALWLAADVALLIVLWSRDTARWSRAAPVWEMVAAYVGARAALLALFALGRSLRGARSAAARSARWALVGAALAAPAWTHLVGPRPAWQGAVTGGLLALLALAASASAGAARETWVGLAALLASPAFALAGCAYVLASPALPLAAPLALSLLLPALGLATLASAAMFAPPEALPEAAASATREAPAATVAP